MDLRAIIVGMLCSLLITFIFLFIISGGLKSDVELSLFLIYWAGLCLLCFFIQKHKEEVAHNMAILCAHISRLCIALERLARGVNQGKEKEETELDELNLIKS